MTKLTHWTERVLQFLASETEDDRILYVGKFNELIDNGFTERQAYINLQRKIVEPLLDDADLTWEEYTEATAKSMTRPTLYDVKVWIELASKIGPSAATGNWHAVEHDWEWDVPSK